MLENGDFLQSRSKNFLLASAGRFWRVDEDVEVFDAAGFEVDDVGAGEGVGHAGGVAAPADAGGFMVADGGAVGG